jgi:hypothetical protein
LLSVLVIACIAGIYKYATTRAPVGPDSSTWALGLFYIIGLIIIVGLSVSLFLYKKHTFSLVVILLPFILMIISYLLNSVDDFYAILPVVHPVKPLIIHVDNTTEHSLHIKMECRFSKMGGAELIYKTLEYFVKPKTNESYQLSKKDTQLFAKKASSVGIVIYIRDSIQSQYGAFFQDGEQVYINESPSAFQNGEYRLNIDKLFQRK